VPISARQRCPCVHCALRILIFRFGKCILILAVVKYFGQNLLTLKKYQNAYSFAPDFLNHLLSDNKLEFVTLYIHRQQCL
jgi:hypothetical protein